MSTAVLPAPDSPSLKPRPADPIRLAVVGCGAVTKSNHLPILAGHNRIALTTLVDLDEARAQGLARAYNVPRVVTSLDALTTDTVDAVVLATPPAHHAAATIALASRGLHVFVEKPMATTAADAEAMVAAAEHAGIALSVGLYRRMLPAVRLLRALLESGEFGQPLSIDIEEGGPYGWQLATLDLLTSSAGGGGVLIDIGSHVIDLLLFVLAGEASLTSYEDNGRGGIETDCHARFVVATAHRDVPVRLELSRTRELRNSIRVRCERATLELLRGNFIQLLVHRPPNATGSEHSTPVRMTAETPGHEAFIGYDAFRAQIDGWLTGIVDGGTPELSGRSVLPVVRLIEDCYQHKTAMTEPWTDEGLSEVTSSPASRRRRVLVTGAGGFLGGRAVELLAGRYGYDAVALVKEPRSAARLARWPTEIILGDVCSASDMDRAMRGCDAVVHCAVGTSWIPAEVRKVTVDGSRTVAEAALRAGVQRFVHISTMFVHPREGGGLLEETAPLEPPPDDEYGRNKVQAERAVLAVGRRGLSSIILRPSRIYGPFSKTFTVRPLAAISTGQFVIAGNPDVPANMVYVDNVVDAIAGALNAPATLGGSAYLINDSDQLTLREFYEFFAKTTGATIRCVPDRPNAMGAARAGWLAGLRTIALAPEVRALVHRILDTDPVGTWPRRLWDSSPKFQAAALKAFGVDAAVVYRPAPSASATDLPYWGDAALVSSAKAERELGFSPPVSPSRAMALTLAWAREARLLAATS